MLAQEMAGERRVDEDDLGTGVGEDGLQFLGSQAEIERIDDAPSEKCGMVELQ